MVDTERTGFVRTVCSATSVEKHLGYGSYGNVTIDSAPYLEWNLAYRGKYLDLVADLQNNLNRWYDAYIAKWISTDPIGFQAVDANLYRYVNNGPLWQVDPEGMEKASSDDYLDTACVTNADYEIRGFVLAAYTGQGVKDISIGEDGDDDSEALKETFEMVLKAMGKKPLLKKLKFYSRVSAPTAQLAAGIVYSIRIDAVVSIDFDFKVCSKRWLDWAGPPWWYHHSVDGLERQATVVMHAFPQNGEDALNKIDRDDIINGAKIVMTEWVRELNNLRNNSTSSDIKIGVKQKVEKYIEQFHSAEKVEWRNQDDPSLNTDNLFQSD